MKTAIIGAGQGCRAVLELFEQGRLQFLDLDIVAVVDIDPRAPGMRFAEERGWPTLGGIEEALALPGLGLVIELTGLDEVLDRIHRGVPPGVRVMDHMAARVFWDLEEVAGVLRRELAEKTQLQARAARERARLQEVLDVIPDMMVELDAEMRIDRVNQRFERVTGKSRESVQGRSIRDVFGEEDERHWPDDFVEAFEAVMTSGRPLTLTRDRRTGSGREDHFQISANPLFDENLEIVRVVITSRAITELVLLKRETEESARRFQQITDAVHGIITIKDLEGRYQMVNPMTARVVGIPREEMLGKTAADLFSEEVAREIHEQDRQTLAKGGRHVVEEVLRVGGRERHLLSERFPLADHRGEVVGICCVSRDLTRYRQLQRDLVRSERLAAVGQLAAGVAHELNSPLSGILTFAEDLLLEAEPDDPARADYEVIVNETLRCRRIVRDLLEFSRQKSPERKMVQINEIVSRVLVMVERQASFHNVTFDVDRDPGLPEIHVDPHKIQQALLDLVINARDSMKAQGRISIRTRLLDGGAEVELSVADEGCGIPRSQIEEIFKPFVSSKGDQGYGLGLAGVRTIVEQHDGRIEVESEVGAGSRFRILLPVSTG